jgi:RNA polymerase-binding transcription factor DksA
MERDRARHLLERRRDELQKVANAAVEQGSLDTEQRSSSGEIAPLEAADNATDTFEREVDLSILESAQASLRDVERALERVESGIYGLCPECGGRIDDERLEAKPEAEYCVEHQPA